MELDGSGQLLCRLVEGLGEEVQVILGASLAIWACVPTSTRGVYPSWCGSLPVHTTLDFSSRFTLWGEPSEQAAGGLECPVMKSAMNEKHHLVGLADHHSSLPSSAGSAAEARQASVANHPSNG